ASSLGLEGEASVAEFEAMFEGRDPTTKELLGRPHGRNAVPAFDVVLRPTKSVSHEAVRDALAAHPTAGPDQQAMVRDLCQGGLDEVVTAFRNRRLDHTTFPSVYLDATSLHVRNATSQVVSMAAVVATGITADGGREALGLDVGDGEDEVFWRGLLTALRRRGLTRVRLVISDRHSGLVAALK